MMADVTKAWTEVHAFCYTNTIFSGMIYVKKGKRVGNQYSWIFRDESDGALTVVEQFD